MLNSVKLHDGLWSIGLASMFNWSPTSGSSQREPCESGSGGDGESASEKVSLDSGNNNNNNNSGGGVKEQRSRQQNFDPSALYHHFPFSTNFNLLRPESCKESIMKNAGGKSFTIDSLLGINAAQVAIQNRIHAGNRGRAEESSIDGNWNLDKHHGLDHCGENRTFNPRKERHAPYARSSNADKMSEKPQKNSRRTTKSKRVRTIFTPEQLERLESEFERQQYMVGPERLYLASTLYLTEAQSSHSHLDNREDDVFEDDSDDDEVSTKSQTPPPSDFSSSNAGGGSIPSFTGSLTAQQLPVMDAGPSCPPNKMFPGCTPTGLRNYTRGGAATSQECNKIGNFLHNSDHGGGGGGCDDSSSYLAHHSPSLE
ncbi:Homeobox protein not2 [Folsomia candida]|uniref:Homeobox protein not2 n=1 Tax=Folsomia candida TaxID=158441 RepID=A0A226E685_FOLCA|nr:Homeobox protein not2 [Folsomia candida]